MKSGRPARIYIDNARRASDISDVCAKYGVEIMRASPMRPTTMGVPERFFGQLNSRFIRHLPGYARSQRQAEQRPATAKRLSFAALETEIEHFIQQWNDKQGAQE